jgi:hypothetical protein
MMWSIRPVERRHTAAQPVRRITLSSRHQRWNRLDAPHHGRLPRPIRVSVHLAAINLKVLLKVGRIGVILPGSSRECQGWPLRRSGRYTPSSEDRPCPPPRCFPGRTPGCRIWHTLPSSVETAGVWNRIRSAIRFQNPSRPGANSVAGRYSPAGRRRRLPRRAAPSARSRERGRRDEGRHSLQAPIEADSFHQYTRENVKRKMATLRRHARPCP